MSCLEIADPSSATPTPDGLADACDFAAALEGDGRPLLADGDETVPVPELGCRA
ncbi:MAG: hypothetical protein R3F65_11935 [bacterium]